MLWLKDTNLRSIHWPWSPGQKLGEDILFIHNLEEYNLIRDSFLFVSGEVVGLKILSAGEIVNQPSGSL